MSARATEKAETAVFRALGHPVRLQILQALRWREECVCHLAVLLHRPQPYVSQRLAELREADLVLDRREGLRVYYRLADPSVGTVLDAAALLLLRTGRLAPTDIAIGRPPREPLPGCECPRCVAA